MSEEISGKITVEIIAFVDKIAHKKNYAPEDVANALLYSFITWVTVQAEPEYRSHILKAASKYLIDPPLTIQTISHKDIN